MFVLVRPFERKIKKTQDLIFNDCGNGSTVNPFVKKLVGKILCIYKIIMR